jgi:NMD protein affecting ribosome stability and mRNA decay
MAAEDQTTCCSCGGDIDAAGMTICESCFLRMAPRKVMEESRRLEFEEAIAESKRPGLLLN